MMEEEVGPVKHLTREKLRHKLNHPYDKNKGSSGKRRGSVSDGRGQHVKQMSEEDTEEVIMDVQVTYSFYTLYQSLFWVVNL